MYPPSFSSPVFIFYTRHAILSLNPRNGTVNYSQTAVSEIDVVYWLCSTPHRPQMCTVSVYVC